jgi:hypothetical protein
MRRLLPALLAASMTLSPGPAHGLFHLAEIHEVMTSYGGDPTVQFVEIRMLAASQQFVFDTVLGAFDASGAYVGDVLVVPGNVAMNATNVRWIMGTASFAAASGLTPDFTMPAGMIPTAGGMICWGAPGIIAPSSATWDHALVRSCSNDGFVPCTTDADCTPGFCQLNYVDCLAYGTYAGPTNSLTGTPTPLDAVGHALVRTASGNDNALTFACGDPATPTRNDGASASMPATTPCPGGTTTTTSTSTATTTSTTTTLPGAQAVRGTKLLLKDPGDDATRKLVVVAKERDSAAVVVGNPIADGAALAVDVTGTTPSSTTFPLPAGAVFWKPVGSVGFKYTDPAFVNGPVKVLLVKKTPGGVFLLKAVGKGAALNPVPNTGTSATVSFTVGGGGGTHCTTFGGAAGGTSGPNDDKTFKVKSPTATPPCP